MLAHAKRGKPFGAHLLEIFRPVAYLQNPFREPAFEVFDPARLIVIGAEKRVVAPIVALHGGRMRASGFMHNSGNQKPRDQRAIRVRGDYSRLDNFFGDDNYFP